MIPAGCGPSVATSRTGGDNDVSRSSRARKIRTRNPETAMAPGLKPRGEDESETNAEGPAPTQIRAEGTGMPSRRRPRRRHTPRRDSARAAAPAEARENGGPALHRDRWCRPQEKEARAAALRPIQAEQ